MSQLSKLVWSEGMHLAPHHFQAQSRYFEDLVHFTTSALWFEPFGWVGYEMDREAIRNGTVALVHGRGIFPDGLPFQMPESDPLPAARSIVENFPPSLERLTVNLAVPAHRVSGRNCAPDSAADGVRYVAEPRPLADEVTGMDERAVQVGRKNVLFLLETEPADGFATLPAARVTRDATGRFVYDETFIPPCLQIAASATLTAMAHRLAEMLDEKGRALAQDRPGGGWFGRTFSSREITGFWFRHAINSGLAGLRHLLDSKSAHPERLYLELAQLAGALCTFRIESHPRSLPSYAHAHPEECFHALDAHIRTHLETVIPTQAIPITLRPAGQYLYAGNVTDQRCLDRARWILGIHSKVGEADLISKTPQLVKVCSAEFVGELVKRALPGLGLTHLPTPPSAIAPRVESQYFGVSRSGPCWEHIVKTRAVGVYVPGELPNPQL
ncbi:MAG TPA: type VI secretion system baseplate subunit TssK, partial [Terriglobia bacterium]|nr:type VI secretion system baseplate subunit TssK [Terriglobia bacterium]